MPLKIRYEAPLDSRKQYIICPNHFSYLDIPTCGLLTINTVFVGKNAMEKIPLFGWMYKKLHITVDRTKLKSRYETVMKSLRAVDEGKNLVIFPEGGVLSNQIPLTGNFKDGPFRIAIEKQLPVVPVTIYNNWSILPDLLFQRIQPIEFLVHKPIETIGMDISQIKELRDRVKNILDHELKNRFNL